MSKKGVKMDLKNFLGDKINTGMSLPSAPRVRIEGENRHRGGRRNYDDNRRSSGAGENVWRAGPSYDERSDNRPPMSRDRSGRTSHGYQEAESISSWRSNDRSSSQQSSSRTNYNREMTRGSYKMDGRTVGERPSSMRLNLTKRSVGLESGTVSQPSSIYGQDKEIKNISKQSQDENQDKWSKVFSKSSDSHTSEQVSNEMTNLKISENLLAEKEKIEKNQVISPPIKENETTSSQTKLNSNFETKEARKKLAEKKAEEKKKKQEEEKLKKETEKNAREKVKNVMSKITLSDKKGKTLTTHVIETLKSTDLGEKLVYIQPIIFGILSKSSLVKKNSSSWVDQSEMGDLFLHLCNGESIEVQKKFLFGIQEYYESVGFPKGLIEKVFSKLYDNEMIDEDAFIAYKDDIENDTPGRVKAIIQLTEWLAWLETTEEEEEEEYVEIGNL